MFTAEVRQRTSIFKTTLLRAVAAAIATVVTLQVTGIVLQRMQTQDQNDSMLVAMQLLGQDEMADHASMVKNVLTPEKLANLDNSKLRQMLGATLDYFVALDIPARNSTEIEAAMQAAVQLEFAVPTKLALANELNAALLFEELMARILTLNFENSRRIALAEIG